MTTTTTNQNAKTNGLIHTLADGSTVKFGGGTFDLNAESDRGKIRFVASDQRVLMHGTETYNVDNASDEPEDYEIFDFDRFEDAEKWIDTRIAQLTEENDLYQIIHTHSGLDSIEYHILTVDREVYDAEYDEWEVRNEYFGDHTRITLPDEVRDAAYASMRSYHKFLDYEADTYHGVNA